MKQAPPAIQDLARQLLAQEAAEREPSQRGHAVLCVCEKLGGYLSKLIGVVGFQVLLARALALAKAEVPWLGAVQVRADGTLEAFGETASKQDEDEATKGSVALLAQLLGLLVTLIGEALTLRVVGDIWPDASLNDMNPGAEEAS